MTTIKPEPQVSELRRRGDRAYLDYHEQCKRTECLGADAKMQTGKFGREELTAHMIAQELLGKHKAYHDAASYLAASPQEPSRGEIEAGVLDVEKTRDAQWYDAMKWAGIGGLMRVKVMNKMRETAAAVKAAAKDSAARGGKP